LKLVPYIEVTLVSKFPSILCLVAQESRLGRKCSVLNNNCVQFWVDRTSPSQFPDKYGPIPGGLVRTGFFSSTFDNSFEDNLLTVSPIDHILLLLAS
jgi:hypothetical protein